MRACVRSQPYAGPVPLPFPECDSAMIRFTMLGTLDLRSDDGAVATALLVQPKRLALLAYLCSASGAFHRRDTLLGLFWPESDAEHARTSLRKALHVLRRSLGRETVMSRGDEELGIDRSAIWCDVTALQQALSAGRLEDALALYRDDLLAGFFLSDAPQFDRWLEDERTRLRRAAAGAAQALASQCEAAGQLEAAIAWARREVVLAAPGESAVRRVMDLLDRSGDPAGAVAAYDTFVRNLATDYELEPGPETKALVERIRARPARAAPMAPPRAAETPPRRRVWSARLSAVAVLLVGVILALRSFNHSGARTAAQQRAPRRGGNTVVAVLPFTYTSRIGGDQYFADGLQQEVIARLSSMTAITVIDRRAVGRYRADASSPVIAQDLGADFVLRSTLTRDSATIRLQATLVEARSGETVWSLAYRRDPSVAQLIAIQADVARRVAEALQVKIESAERGRSSGRRTENATAYGLFLRATQLSSGVQLGSNGADAAANIAAAELLHEAIALDPLFAAGVAELANVYWARAYVLGDSGAWTDSAIVLARHAIALDPHLPSAYRPLGRGYLDKGLLTDAERTYGKILELNPNDGDALLVLGWLAFLRGRIPDAERFWLDARAVDPLNVLLHFDLGLIQLLFANPVGAEEWDDAARALRGDPGAQVNRLLREGKTREAMAAAERFLATHPRSFTALQDAARAAIEAREYEHARRYLEEMQRRGPSDWDYFGLTYRTALVHVLVQTGDVERGHTLLTQTLEDARRRLAAGDERPGIQREIAALHAELGETEEAYSWLRRAIASGWRLEALHPSPSFDRLRADTRFRELIDRIEADLRRARAIVAREEIRPKLNRVQ